MKPKFLGIVLCAGLALALAGCGQHAVKEDVKKGDYSVAVTVAPLERRVVERTVEILGTLRGWEQVTVGAKHPGRVVKVLHDIGDRVKPGEPLVELDPVDARLGVEQAESKYLGELVKLGITRKQAQEYVQKYGISEELLSGHVADDAIVKVPSVVQKRVAREKAKYNLDRQRALSQRGAGTVQELDDAENELRSAEANYDDAVHTARTVIASAVAAKVALEQAKQTLLDTVIRAPMPTLLPPGMKDAGALRYAVSRRSISEGQMIKEGEAVCELVIEDPVRLWCQAPEQYVGEVKLGQKVRLLTRAQSAQPFEGLVSRINPAVDPASRTFQVETVVPNGSGLLRPGGFARASIVVDAEASAAVVPVEALVRFAGVTKIFVAENGVSRVIDGLTTGREGPGWIEIAGKLPQAADVITSGQTRLANGTRVTIRQPLADEKPRPPAAAQSAQTPAAPVREASSQ